MAVLRAGELCCDVDVDIGSGSTEEYIRWSVGRAVRQLSFTGSIKHLTASSKHARANYHHQLPG